MREPRRIAVVCTGYGVCTLLFLAFQTEHSRQLSACIYLLWLCVVVLLLKQSIRFVSRVYMHARFTGQMSNNRVVMSIAARDLGDCGDGLASCGR